MLDILSEAHHIGPRYFYIPLYVKFPKFIYTPYIWNINELNVWPSKSVSVSTIKDANVAILQFMKAMTWFHEFIMKFGEKNMIVFLSDKESAKSNNGTNITTLVFMKRRLNISFFYMSYCQNMSKEYMSVSKRI